MGAGGCGRGFLCFQPCARFGWRVCLMFIFCAGCAPVFYISGVFWLCRFVGGVVCFSRGSSASWHLLLVLLRRCVLVLTSRAFRFLLWFWCPSSLGRLHMGSVARSFRFSHGATFSRPPLMSSAGFRSCPAVGGALFFPGGVRGSGGGLLLCLSTFAPWPSVLAHCVSFEDGSSGCARGGDGSAWFSLVAGPFWFPRSFVHRASAGVSDVVLIRILLSVFGFFSL